MTVKELIEELNKIEDKNIDVCYVDDDDMILVNHEKEHWEQYVNHINSMNIETMII